MATSSSSPSFSSSLLSTTDHHRNPQPLFLLPCRNLRGRVVTRKLFSFKIQAAKLPQGVELPKVEPKFDPPFLGFTRTAEIWNSRTCMIGLLGIFIIELILNKGILQVIGVDVGKGLDLPL